MSNITKELKNSKNKQEEQLNNNDVVKEVKLLMAADSAEDLRIFRALGKHHSIAVSETELGKKLELEKLDNKFAGNVFTRNQIKKLAIKYNLRFLQSKYYKGKIDVQVAGKIKEFAKETNTEITNGNLEYNFYILAPENSFKLREVTTLKIWDDKDPAIFYKIDDDHYRLIHKWGSDFTINNRIAGLLNYNWWTAFFVIYLMAAPILVSASYLIFNKLWIGFVAAFVFSFFRYIGRLKNLFEYETDFYSPYKWNTDIRLR